MEMIKPLKNTCEKCKFSNEEVICNSCYVYDKFTPRKENIKRVV